MACMAHLLQISRAQLLYLQDWDERFLPWWQPAPRQAAPSPEMLEEPSGPTSHLHRSRHRFWTDLLQPYLCDSGVLRDPGGSGAVREARGEWLTDYALNTWGPGGRGTQDDPYFHWPGPGLTLPDVARPAETITLMDGLTTTRETLNAATRHRNGMIAAFVDGHARWLSLSQFWRTDTNGDGFYWLQYGAVDR